MLDRTTPQELARAPLRSQFKCRVLLNYLYKLAGPPAMDTAWLSEGLGGGAPAALGGCRCGASSFEACEYDVFVFDGARGLEEMLVGGRTVIVRHDSLDSPSSGTFAHVPQLVVIRDEDWSAAPKIAAIKEKRGDVFRHAAKSALVASMTMARAARASLDACEPAAPFWTKCAAYRLADAVSYHNGLEPGGAHMPARLRELPKSAANETLQAVYECLGLERAAPPLLGRMLKSAVGFARMAGAGPLATGAISGKAASLESSSLPADCHYYIGRAVCSMLEAQYSRPRAIPDPELYALKVALDPDSNAQHTASHIRLITESADLLARHVGWPARTGA